MIRDLQDNHHGSPDDLLLRRTSKFVTLGYLEVREKNTKKRKGRRSEGPASKRKDKADETPREADKRKIIETVEGRRTVTRRSEVAAEATRWKKDTRGMKPRLGLESDAAAKKFM